MKKNANRQTTFAGWSTETPEDGERYLVDMKHGLIEGTWNAREEYFQGYYFTEIRFYGERWIKISDLDNLLTQLTRRK